VTASAITLTAKPREIDRRGLGALAIGHAGSDLCQGAVPALLPFLIHQRHYSYATASALVLAMAASSSMIQPLFGYLADRHPLPALMPIGLLVGGTGIALAGVVPTYPLTLAAITISGIGVAAFHPEAARYANYVSGSRRASGMSVFAVGGNAGFALGPAGHTTDPHHRPRRHDLARDVAHSRSAPRGQRAAPPRAPPPRVPDHQTPYGRRSAGARR
jgi:predicted MFS family arabinose efflux permease